MVREKGLLRLRVEDEPKRSATYLCGQNRYQKV